MTLVSAVSTEKENVTDERTTGEEPFTYFRVYRLHCDC